MVSIEIGVGANWENQHEDRENLAWTRTCIEAMQPFSGGSEYLNFPGLLEQGEETLRKTFGSNDERLIDLKKKHGPSTLFRLNANSKPGR
jgi:hypothetical protein